MTTFLIIACIIAVAAMWCWTPFSLFGVDGRLVKVEASYRRHTEEMTTELKRLNDILQTHGADMFVEAPATDRTLMVRNGMTYRRG